MKLTKPKLKQIIKESLEDEDMKKKLVRLFINPEHRQQALELATSLGIENNLFVGADLKNADLRGIDLKNANLTGANLSDADLRDAILYGVKLIGADLRGTDLRGAELQGANLQGADLRFADLSVADLRGADLTGADIGTDSARWAHTRIRTRFSRNIRYDNRTKWPEGFKP